MKRELRTREIISGTVLRRNYKDIIFVFLAFAVMSVTAYFFISNILRENLLRRTAEIIHTAEANIRTGLLETESTLLNAYYMVQSMIKQNASQEEILDYLTFTTNWMRQQDHEGLLGFYGIYGFFNGEFLDSIGMNPGSDYIPQTRPWYQLAMRSGYSVAYTAPFNHWYTGDVVIAAVRNVDASGVIAGILAVDMNINWLVDYVSEISPSSGGYGMLLSQDMVIMAHRDSSLMGKRLYELGGSYADISLALRNGETVSYQKIRDLNGNSAIVFFSRIFNDWYVGLVIPYFQFNRDIYFAALILIVLGLVLSCGLSWTLLRISGERVKSENRDRAKSSFLASMSHEIRTPMNAIIGMAEMVLRKDLSEEVRGYIQDIKHAGGNLISIINDILDLSKIESGKLEIQPADYLLSSLINDSVNIIRPRLEEKPLQLCTDIDSTIPNGLTGDEVRVRQILLNLLSNAVKYTEKGNITLKITKEEIDDEQILLKISVSDTGKGIKPDDQKKLFAQFSQVDAKSNIGIEGTGLGLAISKQLCELMGGNINLESEYGKGSTFTAIIPQTVHSPEALGTLDFNARYYEEDASVIKNTFPNARILLVDDLPTNLKVAEGLLAPYKARIDSCLSGAKAIEFVQRNEYDIIFMDHMMPEMDGIEATARIREFNAGVPIVALTANAVVGMKEKFIEHGFNDFLAKPIDLVRLDEIVNKYLAGEQVTSEREQPAYDKEQVKEKKVQFVSDSEQLKISDEKKTAKSDSVKTTPVHVFSCFLFAVITLFAFAAYSFVARQINRSYIEQQLAIASETIRLRLATTVNEELALVLKMADTPIIRNYFLNPSDPGLMSLAQEEIYRYEQHFHNKMVFWVSDIDKIFHSTGFEPFAFDPYHSENYWYNMTMYETEKYNFNINYNPDLRQIYLWVNVPVFAEEKPIGIIGTGIDLTEFSEFVTAGYIEFDRRITPYIFNKFYEITSSLNYDLIFNKVRIDERLGDAGAELIRAANTLTDNESKSFVFNGNIYQLSSIPAMEWFLVVYHPIPGILALNNDMNFVFFGMLFLILLMFIVINIFISRSEKVLAQQNKQLLEANRTAQIALQAKNNFLGKISHEIRTPINAITGMNELVLRSDISGEVQSYAKEIKQAGEQLTSIIDEILNYKDDIQQSPPTAASSLPPIKGINSAEGIAGSGGADNYLKVLSLFAQDAQARLPLLRNIPHNENMSEFITQVHALKSASASIGALSICEKAAALENAGNAGNYGFIREKLPVFADQLSEIVDNIKAALNQNIIEQEVPEPSVLQSEILETDIDTVNTVSVSCLLKTLSGALEKQDVIEIDNTLDEISRSSLDSETKMLLDEINRYVLMADYGKARNIIEEINGK